MSAYMYRPLEDESSIRIVSLRPARSRDAPIIIELGEMRIDRSFPCDTLDYEALSYVWGAKIGDRAIVCEGAYISVTPNCEAALRRLRWETETRNLWIDAICIDQSNTVERSTQVSMMDSIYANAKRVLIWLGEHANLEDEHISVTDGLEAAAVYREAACAAGWTSADNAQAIMTSPMAWSMRLWTLQELAFAQTAMVVIGNLEIPWRILCKGRKYLPEHLRAGITSRQLLAGQINTSHRAGRDSTLGMDLILERVIKGNAWVQASDDRDYVYGLLGIFRANGLEVDEPDYSKTAAKVFEEMTLKLIARTGHIFPMFGTHYQSKPGTLPTWVIDWRINADTITMKPDWMISWDTSTFVEPPDHRQGQLPVYGHLLGEIHQIHYEKFQGDQSHSHLSSLLQRWTEFAQNTFGRNRTRVLTRNDPSCVELLRILFQHCRCDVATLEEEAEAWQAWASNNFVDDIFDNDVAFTADRRQKSVYELLDLVATQHVPNVLNTPYHFWVFRLGSGHLGLFAAPEFVDIRKGDEVLVVAGAMAPIIVRPLSDGSYRLGSPFCVIEGAMYGECWPKDPMALDSFTLV